MNKIGQPFFEGGEYVHSGFCSGSTRYPRGTGLGNCCSCHSIDLYFRKLAVIHNGKNTKRTLWVSECSGCQKRREFPHAGEPVPRETFCQDCTIWNPVKEVSWDGLDFAKLFPVIPR